MDTPKNSHNPLNAVTVLGRSLGRSAPSSKRFSPHSKNWLRDVAVLNRRLDGKDRRWVRNSELFAELTELLRFPGQEVGRRVVVVVHELEVVGHFGEDEAAIDLMTVELN